MSWLRFRTIDSAIDEALHRQPQIAHWFKYTQAQWADELVNEGKIRVGTLRDYRDREKYQGGRLDEEEGTFSMSMELNLVAQSNDDIPEFARPGFSLGPEASNVTFKDCRHTQTFVAPNAYVLCVSKRYAPEELLKDFAPADACVEIINPPAFVTALNEAMKQYGNFVGAYDCQYTGRHQAYSEQRVHAFVAKEPRFADQQEVRVGWLPHDPPTAAFVDLQSRALRPCCRRIL